MNVEYEVRGKMYFGGKKRKTVLLGTFDTMYQAIDFIDGEDYILDVNEEVGIRCVEK